MRAISTFRFTFRYAAVAALAAIASLVTGCSNPPMAGYDSEKSRLRDALPGSVVCTETPHPGGKILECAEKNFELVLTGAKAQDASDIVNVQMSFENYFNAGYPRNAIEKILTIYDVTGGHANGCLRGESGVYSKPADSFVLRCQQDERSLRISISQQRRV